jgi:hypothetical protein
MYLLALPTSRTLVYNSVRDTYFQLEETREFIVEALGITKA